MKTLCVFLMFISCSIALHSQIVEHPIFKYEQLSWEQHVDTVKKRLSDKPLIKTEQSKDQLFKKPKEETFLLLYTDTIFSETVAVGMQFTTKDSLLRVVQVSYFGIDPKTSKQYDDVDDRVDELTTKFTTHYGKTIKDKTLPFVGEFKSWKTTSSDIQLMKISSSSILIIHFTPRDE